MCILLGKVSLTLTRFSDGVKVIRNILYESMVPKKSQKRLEGGRGSKHKYTQSQPDNTE